MSSRRDNLKRIFVGNLPQDVRHRDLEDLFHKYGNIAFIELKTKRGPPFAFVEFTDYRDAQDAVRHRNGRRFEGNVLRVEFPRGRERTSKFRNGSGGSSRNSQLQRHSKYRVIVKGLPQSGSWQDLKDHMREIGEVCYADVYKGGEGVVEFLRYEDMRHAIKKLNNTKFKSHEGDTSYITLREGSDGGDSRSRSRSPVNRRRSSPAYSPRGKRPHDSVSRSRSRSRSPGASSRSHNKRPTSRERSESRSLSRSRSRSKSRSRSASRSRSKSATPQSPSRSKSRSATPRSASRSKSRSASPRSASRSKSRSASPRSARGSRSRSRSKSASRSPSRSVSKSPRINNDQSPPLGVKE